jgi:hypothetical protein
MGKSIPNSAPSGFGGLLLLQAAKRRVIRVSVRAFVTSGLGGHSHPFPLCLVASPSSSLSFLSRPVSLLPFSLWRLKRHLLSGR